MKKSHFLLSLISLCALAACDQGAHYAPDGQADATEVDAPEADAPEADAPEAPAVARRHLSTCQPELRWAQVSQGDFMVAPGLFAFAPHDGLLIRSPHHDHGRAFGLRDGASLFRLPVGLGQGALSDAWNFYVNHDHDAQGMHLALRSMITHEVLATSAPLETLPGRVFSPDGAQVAAVSCQSAEEVQLWLWDIEDNALRQVATWEDELCGSWGWSMDSQLQFTPEGDRLLAPNRATGEVIQVDLASGRLTSVQAHRLPEGQEQGFSSSGALLSMQVSPRGDRVATIGQDEQLRLWSLPSLEPLGDPIEARSTPVNAMSYMPGTNAVLAWSADGSLLAHQAPDGEVVLRDTQSWAEVLRLERPEALLDQEVASWGNNPVAVAFHRDNNQVALSTESGVALWSCPDVELPAPHQGARVLLDGPRALRVGQEAQFQATHLGTAHLHGHAFWINGELHGEPSTARTATWTPQAAGRYEVTVVVEDGLGQVQETLEVEVTP